MIFNIFPLLFSSPLNNLKVKLVEMTLILYGNSYGSILKQLIHVLKSTCDKVKMF